MSQGAYAQTYRVPGHAVGDVVYKVLRHRDVKLWLAEVDLLSTLRHPNVIRCVDIWEGSELAIVMPYGGRSVHAFIHEIHRGVHPLISWNQLVPQVLMGVCALHEAQVIHTDIKPANMVVDGFQHLRLIDLGSAVVDREEHRALWMPTVREHASIALGTLWYRAPELLLGWREFTKAVDIWAVGVSIWEMWVGHALVEANCDSLQTRGLISVFSPLDRKSLRFLKQLPGWDDGYAHVQPRPLLWRDRLESAAPSAEYAHWLKALLLVHPQHRPMAKGAFNALVYAT